MYHKYVFLNAKKYRVIVKYWLWIFRISLQNLWKNSVIMILIEGSLFHMLARLYISSMQNYVLQCKWNTMHCLMICRSTKVCCVWLKRQISKLCFKSYAFKSYIFKNREKRGHRIYYICMLYTKWNFIMYLINGALTDLQWKIYCYLRQVNYSTWLLFIFFNILICTYFRVNSRLIIFVWCKLRLSKRKRNENELR